MISYAQTDLFSAEELRLFRRAEGLVAALPFATLETPLGVVRCHELARAVAVDLNRVARDGVLHVRDGKFGQVDHSWIELPTRNILDVYAVGSLPQVQLVYMSTGALRDRNRCYQTGLSPRGDIRQATCDELLELFAGAPTLRSELDASRGRPRWGTVPRPAHG